jgi:hypothetical protein
MASFKDLHTLRLGDSPVPESIKPLFSLRLIELDVSGDSWVRMEMLEEAAKLPWLKTLRMGHFEHSDCDCYSVAPL